MALVLSGSIDISGSMTATTILVSSPGSAGMVSSSQQITELVPLMQSTASLNSSTSSLIGITNGLMAVTASMKAASIVSSSQQVQNYNLFAVTSSANTFYGNQSISGSLNVISATGAIRLNASSTTSVSTSVTTISTNTNTYGGLAIVSGDNGAGASFSDLIFYSLATVSVLSGHNVTGGPAGRTYSITGAGLLRVTMGAGTYAIRYQALLTT